jgi:hypothetical protein
MGSPLVIWYFSSLEKTLPWSCWDEFVFGGKKVSCWRKVSPAKR